MPLKPYEEFAPEKLAFPIGGKLYVVEPVGYKEGLRLTEMIASKPGAEFKETAEDIWRLVLGKAYDAMKKDNVPGDALARAAFAALTDFQFGRDAAETVWESGVDPKALTDAMQRRMEEAAGIPSQTRAGTGRAQPQDRKPKASPRSRSTASASRTRTASTRSTTSRKTS